MAFHLVGKPNSLVLKMGLVKISINYNQKKEKMKHKLKRLVPSPNSFFMNLRCPECLFDTSIFSHSQTSIYCEKCNTILCRSTGGKARLTEGSSFFKKKKRKRI